MTGRATRLAAVALIICAAAAAGCRKDTPVTPDPVLTTDTFTGTVSPLGSSSHTFVVNYVYAFSDASVTVTRLESAADGSAKAITIGVGFGAMNVGVCNTLAQVTNPAAAVNTELPTSGGIFGPGTYCIQIFDNPSGPTVTEPLNYTLVVKHY